MKGLQSMDADSGGEAPPLPSHSPCRPLTIDLLSQLQLVGGGGGGGEGGAVLVCWGQFMCRHLTLETASLSRHECWKRSKFDVSEQDEGLRESNSREAEWGRKRRVIQRENWPELKTKKGVLFDFLSKQRVSMKPFLKVPFENVGI